MEDDVSWPDRLLCRPVWLRLAGVLGVLRCWLAAVTLSAAYSATRQQSDQQARGSVSHSHTYSSAYRTVTPHLHRECFVAGCMSPRRRMGR